MDTARRGDRVGTANLAPPELRIKTERPSRDAVTGRPRILLVHGATSDSVEPPANMRS